MRRALEGIAGVQMVELRFDTQDLAVTCDPGKTTTDAMIATIKKAKNFDAKLKRE